MQVLDVFELPEQGVVITGTNSDFDLLEDQVIRHLIGNKILLETPDGKEIEAEVSIVDIGKSLIGKKNISICLFPTIHLSDIKLNSTVLGFRQQTDKKQR